MADKKVQVSAELSDELVETLKKLAEQRGVTANTVLEQAIATEKFFADKLSSGKKVLIENDDRSMEQVFFKGQ